MTPGTTVRLAEDLDERVLFEALMSAARLGGALEAFVNRLATGNPVVVNRAELAPLQAALDAWSDASSRVLDVSEPEPEAGPCEDGSPDSRPCVAQDDYRIHAEDLKLEEESPTERRARELRAGLEGP